MCRSRSPLTAVSCISPAAFVLSAVLINLLPDFLAVLGAGDREAAYRQYRESHRPILDAYWRNYVLDPDSPHAGEIITAALRADRSDLLALADAVNVVHLAEEAIGRHISFITAWLLVITTQVACYYISAFVVLQLSARAS